MQHHFGLSFLRVEYQLHDEAKDWEAKAFCLQVYSSLQVLMPTSRDERDIDRIGRLACDQRVVQ